MQIAREQVVDLLKSQGDHARANQAESVLPVKVDPDQDAHELASIGIEPAELRGILPGNFGG